MNGLCEHTRFTAAGSERIDCSRPAAHSFIVAPRGTASPMRRRLRYCTYHYNRLRNGKDYEALHVVEYEG